MAGPVVAACVLLKNRASFSVRIDDSKKLSPAHRFAAYQEILKSAEVGVGIVDAQTIDRVRILEATLLAMRHAVESLARKPQLVLIDGLHTPSDLKPRAEPVVRGDQQSLSIACASIVAKVVRDDLMAWYDKLYPKYGFAKHKGYGTRYHSQQLQRHGPCPIHRQSFAPVRGSLN